MTERPSPVELSGVSFGPSHRMILARAREHLVAFESAAKTWRNDSAQVEIRDADPQVIREMMDGDAPFEVASMGGMSGPFRSFEEATAFPGFFEPVANEVGTELIFKEVYPINRNWALILNEGIHGLRSSLDHIAYALACANTEGPLPDDVAKGSEFPIFWDRAPSKTIIEKKIGAIHPNAQAIIKRLQPHKSPDYREHPLWMLHELDRVGKHRLLPIIRATISTNAVGALGGHVPIIVQRGGEVKDGAPIAYYIFIHGDPQLPMEVEFRTRFDIDFGDGLPTLGSCSKTFAVIGQYIKDEVFAPLEPFLAPAATH